MNREHAEKLLGLYGSYTEEDARSSYHALAKKYHPDTADPQAPSSDNDFMTELNEAYDIVQKHVEIMGGRAEALAERNDAVSKPTPNTVKASSSTSAREEVAQVDFSSASNPTQKIEPEKQAWQAKSGAATSDVRPPEKRMSMKAVIGIIAVVMLVIILGLSIAGTHAGNKDSSSASQSVQTTQVPQASESQQQSSNSATANVEESQGVRSSFDKSLNGSYVCTEGDSSADSSFGGHFSKFDVSGLTAGADTFDVHFEWYDAGSAEPTISGYMTAHYTNDGDLGDFSAYTVNEKTHSISPVEIKANIRVYPDSEKLELGSMEVTAFDSGGAEIYHRIITTMEFTK